MASEENNELLTRVGPGTPMGELMRRYWVPVVFSDQIAQPDSPPLRVRLLCEDMVVFRDTGGRVGLVHERCPHRTASLFFGRNEENGLRCVYHGIKFDVDGQCVDVPCVPPGLSAAQLDTIKRQMRVRAYPCIERGGMVWAYMGPPELKPEFPDIEWTLLPADQRYATRHIQECNWLQGVEGGYDAPHLTFLHRNDSGRGHGSVPSIYEVVPTEFGFAVGTARDGGNGEMNWSISILLMPFHKIIASMPFAAHVWAPIDDEHTMLYSINFDPKKPLTDEVLARELTWDGIHTENKPGSDHALANRANDYLIDRALQASGRSFTGIKGFGIQDCAVQESMGAISDRSREHLLPSDVAIVKIRRLFLDTLRDMAEGKPLPGLDPRSYRVRSTRFKAPKEARFLDQVRERVKTEA